MVLVPLVFFFPLCDAVPPNAPVRFRAVHRRQRNGIVGCNFSPIYHGALRCVALRCVALRCVALRCVALRCVALRCVALRCGAVRCGAVQCGAVQCGAVRCGAVRCGVGWCGALWSQKCHRAVQFSKTAVRCTVNEGRTVSCLELVRFPDMHTSPRMLHRVSFSPPTSSSPRTPTPLGTRR